MVDGGIVVVCGIGGEGGGVFEAELVDWILISLIIMLMRYWGLRRIKLFRKDEKTFVNFFFFL